MIVPHSSRRAPWKRCALALVTLGLLAGPATAQDTTAKPEPAPTPTVETEVAPEEEPEIEFLGDSTIRRKDGMIVRFYQTNFVAADVLVKELSRWKTSKAEIEAGGTTFTQVKSVRGKSQPVNVKNVLRISETEENWPVLEGVLRIIDVPEPQVIVEARIVELQYDSELRVGVEGSVVRPLGDTFFQGYQGVFPNTLPGVGASDFSFARNEKFLEFSYILELSERGATGEVRSHPSVLASQGHTAIIYAGTQEPVIQQQLSGSRVSTSTKFENVGLQLEVQPLFIGREFVRARISPEISRIAEFRSTATAADTQVINPVISKQYAETVATVGDGETLVLGGLVQTSKREERTGLPVLKDLPVVGYLFGSTTERKTETEVFFFITFTIVHPWEARLVDPLHEETLEHFDESDLDLPPARSSSPLPDPADGR